VRLYRELSRLADEKEEFYALEFEEPALVTLGFSYEKRPRISGGAYFPILHRTDGFLPAKLSVAATEREARAQLVLDFDDAVNEAVAKLKARGLTSPYLRAFVVARVNPLRFIKGDPPPLTELFPSMTKRARAFNVDKIQASDVAKTGGPPPEPE
jgi:ParB family transcriptional regulator, chromosome partitioning protein